MSQDIFSWLQPHWYQPFQHFVTMPMGSQWCWCTLYIPLWKSVAFHSWTLNCRSSWNTHESKRTQSFWHNSMRWIPQTKQGRSRVLCTQSWIYSMCLENTIIYNWWSKNSKYWQMAKVHAKDVTDNETSQPIRANTIPTISNKFH